MIEIAERKPLDPRLCAAGFGSTTAALDLLVLGVVAAALIGLAIAVSLTGGVGIVIVAAAASTAAAVGFFSFCFCFGLTFLRARLLALAA
jgi:hypothetical protein